MVNVGQLTKKERLRGNVAEPTGGEETGGDPIAAMVTREESRKSPKLLVIALGLVSAGLTLVWIGFLIYLLATFI